MYTCPTLPLLVDAPPPPPLLLHAESALEAPPLPPRYKYAHRTKHLHDQRAAQERLVLILVGRFTRVLPLELIRTFVVEEHTVSRLRRHVLLDPCEDDVTVDRPLRPLRLHHSWVKVFQYMSTVGHEE